MTGLCQGGVTRVSPDLGALATRFQLFIQRLIVINGRQHRQLNRRVIIAVVGIHGDQSCAIQRWIEIVHEVFDGAIHESAQSYVEPRCHAATINASGEEGIAVRAMSGNIRSCS